MTKTITFIIACILSAMSVREGIAGMDDYREPKDSEIFIGHACIELPLERLLLIRKGSRYCAIKFIRYWMEVDEERKKMFSKDVAQGTFTARMIQDATMKRYAAYEAYYQGDGSGDFSKNNVTKNEDAASALPLTGPFRPFIYQPGNSFVECGPIKLTWQYKKMVCFGPPDKGRGDFGFELAPTPWVDISQMNVSDPRIKWYRDDDKRERVYMPIDSLWVDQK